MARIYRARTVGMNLFAPVRLTEAGIYEGIHPAYSKNLARFLINWRMGWDSNPCPRLERTVITVRVKVVARPRNQSQVSCGTRADSACK